MDLKNKRKFRGYYGFSKKYSTPRGTVYSIGESKRVKKKEIRRKVLLTVFAFLLISIVLTAYLFCRNLSERPIPETGKAELRPTVSADNIGEIKAIFIDNEVLSDKTAFQKELDDAKKNGFNSVMLDFKDKDGSVLFPAKSAIGISTYGKNQISENLINEIKSNGFTVVARVFCFEDSYAPQRLGAFVYEDDECTKPWFDAPAALGGKVWLNPANEKAVNYLVNIIAEVSEFGADCIYLSSVQFPVSENGKPVFTEDDSDLSRNFILLNFIEKAVKKANGCPVIAGFSYDGIDGDGEKWGGSIFDSAAAGNSPELLQTENYAKYVGDMWLLLNERAKNNYSTLKCIPTVKDMPESESFYSELAENGVQSYIIIP